MDSDVQSLAIDSSGNLYAGGRFTKAGGVTVNHIAKWNGTTWSALGSGIEPAYDGDFIYVNAIAVDSSGNLYAGGKFRKAGGIEVSNIAKWNGTTWSALGSGTNDTVFALAVDFYDKLYVGGMFYYYDGGISSYGIAKWNGTSWSGLGKGVSGYVRALAFNKWSGELYVGGYFSKTNGDIVLNAKHIAKWNGYGWSALSLYGIASAIDDEVTALAFNPYNYNELYVGGTFTTGVVLLNSIKLPNGMVTVGVH